MLEKLEFSTAESRLKKTRARIAKRAWHIVLPFAGGFLGISKRGSFWSKNRLTLINNLIEKTYGAMAS